MSFLFALVFVFVKVAAVQLKHRISAKERMLGQDSVNWWLVLESKAFRVPWLGPFLDPCSFRAQNVDEHIWEAFLNVLYRDHSLLIGSICLDFYEQFRRTIFKRHGRNKARKQNNHDWRQNLDEEFKWLHKKARQRLAPHGRLNSGRHHVQRQSKIKNKQLKRY